MAVNYNFRKSNNPHQPRTDHFAAALSQIGTSLVSEAMLAKRQASMDEKQDARTKVANERQDARNLIIDKRADDALLLDAERNKRTDDYRAQESQNTAQYRKDTMQAQEDRYLKTDAASARKDALATEVATAKLSREEKKEQLKSYETELEAMIEAQGGEFGKTNPEDTQRMNSLRMKIDVLRGEKPPAPPPVSVVKLTQAKAQGATFEAVNASLKRLGKQRITKEQWDSINIDAPVGGGGAAEPNLLNSLLPQEPALPPTEEQLLTDNMSLSNVGNRIADSMPAKPVNTPGVPADMSFGATMGRMFGK